MNREGGLRFFTKQLNSSMLRWTTLYNCQLSCDAWFAYRHDLQKASDTCNKAHMQRISHSSLTTILSMEVTLHGIV